MNASRRNRRGSPSKIGFGGHLSQDIPVAGFFSFSACLACPLNRRLNHNLAVVIVGAIFRFPVFLCSLFCVFFCSPCFFFWPFYPARGHPRILFAVIECARTFQETSRLENKRKTKTEPETDIKILPARIGSHGKDKDGVRKSRDQDMMADFAYRPPAPAPMTNDRWLSSRRCEQSLKTVRHERNAWQLTTSSSSPIYNTPFYSARFEAGSTPSLSQPR